MLDFSFAEIIVIGVVALVVVGPERLPKVARTAGIMFGRLQRYVSTVKADIAREIEMDGLKQLKTDMEDAARSVRETVTQQAGTLEQAVKQHVGSIEHAVTEQAGALEQAVTAQAGALEQAVTEHAGTIEHGAEIALGAGAAAPGPFIPTSSDNVTPARPAPASSAPAAPMGVRNGAGADDATASQPGPETAPGSAPRAPTMPFSWNEQTASVEAAGSQHAAEEDNPQQLDLRLEQAKPPISVPLPKAQSPVAKE